MTFRDGSEQWRTAFAETYDSTRDVTYHEDVSLGDFFERPVKIATYAWSTADVTPFYQTVDPWTAFITNPRVVNRMTNYQNFSGNLHLKFVINGNSFLYGRLMAEYFPLRAYDNISDTSNATTSLMQASQRLHLYLDPCESQGGEMTLPFIWYYDKVRLSTTEYNALGTLYMRELQPLKHANAASGDVNISVFAWMTNVKLSIPTINDISGIVPQSGKMKNDEYGKGPVSSVASAIAAASGALSGYPVIGPYARATSMVAGVMGKVAAIFGYSKPALIADYVDMRPAYVSRMANTNGGDNVAKLTLDAKQELTIDPQVVGISSIDEMAISSLAAKETYLTQFPWTTAEVAGDALFSIRVGPPWGYASTAYYLPAITYASLPFKYWRGSIIYRFQIVASGYHKGRMLIVWDPLNQSGGAETNVQYSKIVDLADERDFTFEVGWGSRSAWCSVPTLTTSVPYNNVSAIASTNDQFNGVVTVYILNELTVPNVTVNNDIAINVFVSGCADYKLSVPTSSQIASLTTLPSTVPQSGTFEEVATEDKNAPRNETAKETIAMCEPLTDSTDLVYIGETIVSLRQLVKRYNLWGYVGSFTAAASDGQNAFRFPSFPLNRGYHLYGPNAATLGNISPSFTTMLNYLGFAYMAFRGSIRWKIIMDDVVKAPTTLTITRQQTLYNYVAGWPVFTADVVTSAYNYVKNKITFSESGLSGTHVTISEQPVLEFETPYYQDRRFSSTRNMGNKAGFSADDLSNRLTSRAITGSKQTFTMYVAGGEDTTFIGFQGAPPLYVFSLP